MQQISLTLSSPLTVIKLQGIESFYFFVLFRVHLIKRGITITYYVIFMLKFKKADLALFILRKTATELAGIGPPWRFL